MKKILIALLSVGVVAYLAFRALTTFIFMPLAGSIWSLGALYFLVMFIAAAALSALSFIGNRRLATVLSGLYGSASLTYWWFIVCRASTPIWSDFQWLVVPDIGFSPAGLLIWLASPHGRPSSHTEPTIGK